jgi:hypothetical protein
MTMTVEILNSTVAEVELGAFAYVSFTADTVSPAFLRVVYPQEPAIPGSFEDEKAAFTSRLPTLQIQYPGEFVAIYRGTVVEHDKMRSVVTRRFFDRFGDVPVYIGFVGPKRVTRIPTPFVRRNPPNQDA